MHACSWHGLGLACMSSAVVFFLGRPPQTARRVLNHQHMSRPAAAPASMRTGQACQGRSNARRPPPLLPLPLPDRAQGGEGPSPLSTHPLIHQLSLLMPCTGASASHAGPGRRYHHPSPPPAHLLQPRNVLQPRVVLQPDLLASRIIVPSQLASSYHHNDSWTLAPP